MPRSMWYRAGILAVSILCQLNSLNAHWASIGPCGGNMWLRHLDLDGQRHELDCSK
jgi:hypothetical protein